MTDGWFIRRRNEREGPFTWLEMLTKVSSGELKPVDRIARKPMTKWAEAKSIDGLFAAIPPAPRSPQPAPVVQPPPIHSTAVWPAVVEAVVVAEPLAKPAVPVALASPVPKSGSLPFILAGILGLGIMLVGGFGILCVTVFFLSPGSADTEVAADVDSPQLTFDSLTAPIESAGTSAAPTGAPADQSAAEQSTTEAAELQNLLNGLNHALDDSQPQVPPQVAVLVTKAEAGDSESMYELGDRYSEGTGVATDLATAVRWYQKAADGGNRDAMNALAYMYMKGQGVETDQVTGAAWFAKGARAGSPMSMFNYAICLGNGIGVAENQFASRLWIQKSAEAGYEPAQKWVQQAQAEARANLLGAIVGGLFSGGDGDDSSSERSNADEMFTQRRRDREYWEDRARRADAAGDHMDAEYSRRNVP